MAMTMTMTMAMTMTMTMTMMMIMMMMMMMMSSERPCNSFLSSCLVHTAMAFHTLAHAWSTGAEAGFCRMGCGREAKAGCQECCEAVRRIRSFWQPLQDPKSV
eukprot:5552610-Amphidinium_carterae.1